MKGTTIIPSAAIAALALVAPAVASAHTVTGSATCERVDFAARAFDPGIVQTPPLPSTPGAELRIDVAVTFANPARDFSRVILAGVYGSGNYFAPLNITGGTAVVDAWATWTGRDGNNGSIRVDLSPNDPTSPSAFVVCPPAPGPTPAPTPTPGEQVPVEPAPVVIPPTPDRPPVVIPRRPDRPPVARRPRVVTCAFVLAHYRGAARARMIARYRLPKTCGRPFNPPVAG